MATIDFKALNLQDSDPEIVSVDWNDECKIEVKTYLPIEDKISLVQFVLNGSADDNNFANPMKVDVFYVIGIISYYTNINLINDDVENYSKVYDAVMSTSLFEEICDAIPSKEINTIKFFVDSTIEEFYKQQNSAVGIMEKISSDYSNLDAEATEMREKLQSGDFDFLKEVLDKLG